MYRQVLELYATAVDYDPKSAVNSTFFIDTDVFFFKASLDIVGMRLEQVNVCLDTGANRTSLMPRVYKVVREKLKNVRIEEFSIDTVIGHKTALGKLVSNATVKVGDVVMDLVNSPIFFRNNAFYPCDIVLGQDQLSDARLKDLVPVYDALRRMVNGNALQNKSNTIAQKQLVSINIELVTQLWNDLLL